VFHARMVFQESRDGPAIGVMLAHAHGQRLDSAWWATTASSCRASACKPQP
jgi:hypothetical protein